MKITCPICSNASEGTFKEIETVQGIRRLQCRICDLMFFEKLPEKMPEYDTKYNLHFFRPGDIRKAGIMAEKIAELANGLKKNARILEVGSGNGLTTHLLELMGYSAECVEIDQRFAENILAKLYINSYIGKYEEVTVPVKYDVIYAGHVIEHSADILAFTKKAYNDLNENGLFFFDTPDAKYQKEYGADWKHLRTRQDFEHMYILSFKSAFALARRIGFTVANVASLPMYESMQIIFKKEFTRKEVK